MEISNLSSAVLRRAATIKDKINSLENELVRIFERGGISGHSRGLKAIAKVHRKRRQLSVAARKRIGDAARARWAKAKDNGKK